MSFEKPVSLVVHYLTGIVLLGMFIWVRNAKLIPDSKYMGIIYGWITVILPWFFFYPCIGFMGLETPEGVNNIIYSIIYHSFFGLGITLWFGYIRIILLKTKKNNSNNK